MTRYPLEHAGKLLLTKAAISGPAGVRVVRLLVDTGSTYTILPAEVLESVGCSPASSTDHVRLAVANIIPDSTPFHPGYAGFSKDTGSLNPSKTSSGGSADDGYGHTELEPLPIAIRGQRWNAPEQCKGQGSAEASNAISRGDVRR